MLRSVFTLNRTECNRVRHETRYNSETSLRPPWRRPLDVSPGRAGKNSAPNTFGVRLFKG